jgi:hypothetical protein
MGSRQAKVSDIEENWESSLHMRSPSSGSFSGGAISLGLTRLRDRPNTMAGPGRTTLAAEQTGPATTC